MKHSLSKKLINNVFCSLLILLGLVGMVMQSSTQVEATNHVCPGGEGQIDIDGWIKFEHDDDGQSEDAISYDAGSGFVIDQICAKGGNSSNPNGYLFTTNSNGIAHTCDYDRNGNHKFGTITVAGIDSSLGSVTRQDDGCADLSHASFHVTEKEVEEYACNSDCRNDAQCQTVDPGYICSNNKCRLASNPVSRKCENHTPPVFSCNSTCRNDAQCQTADSGYTCVNSQCRLASNPTSATCEEQQASPTPTPSSSPTPSPSTDDKDDDKKDSGTGGSSSQTSDPQGQVLGASTEYAATGVFTDLLMSIMGLTGAGLTSAGTYLYGKKN